MLRRPRLRLALALFAALQILLPVAADLADARTLSDGALLQGIVHIEAEGAADCPRGHPDDCALCHFATHIALKSFGATPNPIGENQHRDGFAAAALQPGSRCDTLPPSRAPPVA